MAVADKTRNAIPVFPRRMGVCEGGDDHGAVLKPSAMEGALPGLSRCGTGRGARDGKTAPNRGTSTTFSATSEMGQGLPAGERDHRWRACRRLRNEMKLLGGRSGAVRGRRPKEYGRPRAISSGGASERRLEWLPA
jgi:hypothetical protein